MNARTLLADAPDLATLDWARVSSLEWRQPQWSRRYWELNADGALAATVTWRGPWRRGFVARTASGVWTIRESLWGRRSIHRGDEEAPVASSVREGFLTLAIERADGERLMWRRESWLGALHVLENRERFSMLRVRRTRGFVRFSGGVMLEDAARHLPDLEPLVILVWALVLAEARRHAH